MTFEPSLQSSYLIDLDGTLASGNELLPGAGQLLNLLKGQFAIVSNDSEHTAEQLSRRFRRWDIDVPPERITLAGAASIEAALRVSARARLMFLGSVALRQFARKLGAHLVDEKPDVVLVARDRRFDYSRLQAAARAVQDGAMLYAACPDWRHPGKDGYPVPEAGVLAEAIARVSGVKIDRVFGKPEPHLFELACQRAGLRLLDCTVIGDNPLTDGQGAAALGLPFVRVEPGHLPELLSGNLAPHVY